MKTLAELKAENAAIEAEAQATDVVESENTDTELAQNLDSGAQDEAEQNESQKVDDEAQDSDTESEGEGSEVEDWLSGDSDDKVSVKKHVGMKQRLKGRIRDQEEALSGKDDELARIKAELEALRQGRVDSSPVVTQDVQMPSYDDFDTVDEYNKAIADYVAKTIDSRLDMRDKTVQAKTQQQQIAKQTESAIDSHYERGAKLIEDYGIEPEVFKSADSAVRRSVEAVMPDQGDVITDALISNLGEGSEKVLYFVGRNDEARAKLAALLAEDKSGIKASIYLGELKATKANSKQVSRRSKAPAPDPSIKGDSGKASETAMKGKYNKETNPQKRYNLRKQAKAAGFNVKEW